MKFIYHSFYHILPIKKVNTNKELFLLNEEEIQLIRRKEQIAIWLAAFFGAMGVLLLYLPQYAFPNLFPVYTITLFGKNLAIPVVMMVYSLILVLIEIMLLTLLNIWCAHEIGVATGFLNHENKRSLHKRNLLIDIGLEKKNKQILKYGIDPFQGINKKALLVWNFFFILKATLSNMLFKILIQRMLGRYAIRAVKDFAGLPIFAGWNAYGTHVIIREARVIIMGQNLIQTVSERIGKDQEPTTEFKELLYDTLQYIAISKREFHQNHYLLTKILFDIYNIKSKDEHWLEKGYFQKLHVATVEERAVCQLLISIGFLLDGKLSVKERLEIHELKKVGLLDISSDEMKKYVDDFLSGRGIKGLIDKFIE